MDHEDLRKIESLKRQKIKADKKGNIKEEADICNYIGEIYARCGRYDDAIKEHKRELTLNEGLEDRIGIAVAHRKLGECYCRKGEFEKALKLHKQYLAIARECSNAVEEQRALATIGKTYLDQRDVGVAGVCRKTVSEAAERAFTQSLEVCERLKPSIGQTEYLDMKARLFLNLGLVHDGNDKAELSNSYMEKALTICKKEQLLEVLYLVQCCLGDAYARQGRYADASRSLDVAAGTARKMKDKQLESDALYSNALIAVQREDFATARHLLKKSHKLALHGSDQALKVLKGYQTVRKIEQGVRDSRAADFEDWDALIPVYDRLGDLYAEIGLYKPAVTHYQNMLSASVSAGRDKKDLAVIHVSIAETLKDDRQYEKAIAHYRKEIECRTDTEQDQICSSLMSIGLLQEQAGCSYKQVQIAYVDAFNAAKKAKNLKLQVRCLNYLIELFKVNKDSKQRAKVEDQMAKLRQKHHLSQADLDPDQEDSQEDSQGVEGVGEGEEGGGSDEEEEIVMSDLTESEDETERVNPTRTLRAVRQNKSYTKKVKLTEFGETPLHKACINGQIDKVKSLLAEGHPLHVQDHIGWTPLHEAANNGHPEIVHLLLDHGAQIDHRGGHGCEGLTPLLDAASAGNFDIMMLLIDRGANINAKDDHQMKAVDHLLAFRENSGELDRESEVKYRNILQILRERDPGYRSKQGCASVALSQRSSGALVPQDTKGRSASSSPSVAPGSQRRSRNDIIMQSDSNSDDDGDDSRHTALPSHQPDSLDEDTLSYTNPHLQGEIPDPHRNASETYRRTIAGVGRSGCQPSQPSKSSTGKPKEKPALLKETEMVDDWLVEDMQPLKRRKVDPTGFTSTLGTRTKRSTGCDSPSDRAMLSERTLSQGSSSRKKRPLSIDSSESETEETAGVDAAGDNVDEVVTERGSFTIVNSDIDDRDSDICSDDDDVRIMFEDVVRDSNAPSLSQASSIIDCSFPKSRKNKKKPRQSKLTGFVQKTTEDASNENLNHTVERSVIHTEARTASANVLQEKTGTCVLKVKVQIKGDVFFIPVIESNGPRTFAWLAEEAAVRYYRKCGLKPHVTLGTTDGAHFSPDDIVSLMVADGDKIEGFLEGWDLPPITERYTEACKQQKTVSYKNVQLLLQASEATGKLECEDLSLRSARFKPVTLAIKCQTCLRHLDIRGNRIGDLGVEFLCASLATLPNLTHLGLACNDITPTGLKHLCNLVGGSTSGTDKSLQSLSSLDLGHNPLYDTCLPQLSGLVAGLTSLTCLTLTSCHLSVKLFQTNRLQLTEALHKSSLHELDISFNTLGCVGAELLLKCQNPTRVQTLDLSAILPPGSGSGSAQLYRHLYNYCTQDNCSVQSLKLCNNNLGMDDTDFLTRLPSLARHLQLLDLSGNPRLTNTVLQQLLLSSSSDSSHLEQLHMRDCKLSSPLGVDLLDCLSEKLGARVPLRRLEMTCFKIGKVDGDSLEQVWRERWGEMAQAEVTGERVRLTVKDS